MAIHIQCPDCLEQIRVEDALAGTSVRCRMCQSSLKVPGQPVPAAKKAATPDRILPRTTTSPDAEDRPHRRAEPKPRGGRFWFLVGIVTAALIGAAVKDFFDGVRQGQMKPAQKAR